MRAQTERLTDVEPKDLQARIDEFADEGAKQITVQRQADGRYTVTAIVPIQEVPN